MTPDACSLSCMQDDMAKSVRQMVERMPQWLRADLSSTDALLRGRAEDALFAMIVAAIDATKPETPPARP